MAQVVNPASASFAPVTQNVSGTPGTPAKYQLLYGQKSGVYTITDDDTSLTPNSAGLLTFAIHAGLAVGNWVVAVRAVDSAGAPGLLTPEIPFSVAEVLKAPSNFSLG